MLSCHSGNLECRQSDDPTVPASILRWVDSMNPEAVHCVVLAMFLREGGTVRLQRTNNPVFDEEWFDYLHLAQWGQERLEEDMRNESRI